jgi:predicted secreted protein
VSLTHHHPDCTGRWDQELIAGRLYWRCERCGAIGYHSDGVAEAALRENQLGTTLQRLSDAGEWLRVDDDEDLGW